MMADDERHGSYAGAVAHWFDSERPCDACARAEWRYRKQRKLDALRGKPRRLTALGTRRRVHALMALGWTGQQIADLAGLSVNTLRSMHYHDAAHVRATTADKVADAYERLCMVVPEGHYADRQRTMARRKGWAVPLAYDDIDRDPHPVGYDLPDGTPDPVVVERLLAGERIDSTRAEKVEALRRWTARGGSERELCKRMGWKPGRYTVRTGVAAA